MKIKVENLGRIDKGEVSTNKLLILCGPNNYGKTYLAYSLYGLNNLFDKFSVLDLTSEELNELELGNRIIIAKERIFENYKTRCKEVSFQFKNDLSVFFNFDSSFFEKTLIGIEVEKKDILAKEKTIHGKLKDFADMAFEFEIKKLENSNLKLKIKNYKSITIISQLLLKKILGDCINSLYFGKAFILPSVREGLNLFNNELNSNRNVLIHNLLTHENKSKDLDVMPVIRNLTSRYARPIFDYIEFINSLEGLVRKEGKFSKLADEISDIVQGEYSYENTQIYFTPYGKEKVKLPLHMSSSTVRSLAGLYMYIKYSDNPQKIIIDEPELNLHPENQRKIARFIVKLVNAGIDVIITTHSSYILQEINLLILLDNDFSAKKKLMKDFGYEKLESINYKDVSSYLVDEGKIEKMETSNTGIVMGTFNKVIDDINELTTELLFEIDEVEEEKEVKEVKEVKKVVKKKVSVVKK